MLCFKITILTLFLLTIGYLKHVESLSKFNTKKIKQIKHRKFFTEKTDNLKLPAEQWFNQSLDHFDSTNKITWKQRYYYNDTFFDGSGPIFLYIVGEWDASPYDVVYGAYVEFAKRVGALCVSLEHRFYGESKPTTDLGIENLKYLNIKQALEDTATFHNYITSKFKLTLSNKWIVFGGSYAGTVAAFFRLKYPHLVHGAVASSAPMYASVNFYQYFEVVQNSLNYFSPSCSSEMSKATTKMIELINDSTGRKYLEELFKTCDPIETEKDQKNFFQSIADYIAGEVQYNGLGGSIKNVCNLMTNDSNSEPIVKFAKVNYNILQSYGESCLDASYDDLIDYFQQKTWNSDAVLDGWRQWIWQTCTEFGWYQSSDSEKQPFGNTFPINFLVDECSDIFGSEFDEQRVFDLIDNTNTHFGGYNFEGTNVLFVNGRIDPWHIISFFDYKPNSLSDIIYLKESSHCADMDSSRSTDSTEMKDARTKIFSFIKNWIETENPSNSAIKTYINVYNFILSIILFYYEIIKV